LAANPESYWTPERRSAQGRKMREQWAGFTPEQREHRIKNKTSRYVTPEELAVYRADPPKCPHADFVVCLECGRKLDLIATLHVRTHGLTKKEYQEKWPGAPMVCNVSHDREFLANAASRKLKPASIQRYRIIFGQLDAFAAAEGLQFFNQLDTRTLTKFRGTWKGNSGLADLKKLERLRAFCKFAVVNGYAARNPAQALENPKILPNPTLPFSSEEMLRILATAAQYIAERAGQAKTRALRVRALALLLRYTGLRISDAVGCAVDRVQNGKVFLYTQKTGQHVYVPLPPFVTRELAALPRVSERYFFWTEAGSVETARKKWTEALADLFRAAGVKGGHPHRFRDTFAVELLKAGSQSSAFPFYLDIPASKSPSAITTRGTERGRSRLKLMLCAPGPPTPWYCLKIPPGIWAGGRQGYTELRG
jgi:site-specific recombinase XerD